jgi:deoxyribonuclease V
MKYFLWPRSVEQAKMLQMEMRRKLRILPLRKKPKFIVGLDAAFLGDKIIGVASVYTYPDLVFLEYTYAISHASFPYVPGFLSFREGPVIVEAFKKIQRRPHAILFDGQGIAHPERMGIATHIGILLNTPSIGCAKSRLIGQYENPGLEKGSWSRLTHQATTVGAVLRTKNKVRPLFISPGHMIDLKASIKIVLNCSRNYRIPEPLRMADHISKRLKNTCLTG